jgi:hypothetical protein
MPVRALASMPARAAIGFLVAAAAFAACGGGAATTPGATPATTPGASSGAASSAQAPSSAPASSPANAASRPAAPIGTGTGTGTGTIPTDECSVVTRTDVEGAFGGSSSVGKIDEHGHCTFEVSGTIHAGPNVSVPGSILVSFGDRFDPYDTANMLFGDAVTKVDGLGTEGWHALTAVHAKIAGGEIAVAGLWVGNFNRDTLKADTITLTKTILARL